jgi:hypothetical protein
MASLNDDQVDRALMVNQRRFLLESLTFLSVALLFVIDFAILHAQYLR